MKITRLLIFVILLILIIPVISSWTPTSNIDGRDYYTIYNFTNISATIFYQDGSQLLSNESSLNVNSSQFLETYSASDFLLSSGGVLTGNLSAGNHTIYDIGHLRFEVSTCSDNTTEGKICWNSVDHTLNLVTGQGGVILQVNQEQVALIVNKEGVTINNGQVVYFNGAQGQRPKGSLARADDCSQTIQLGVATQDIADNDIGFITTFGLVRDIDTSEWSDGDMLYLSATELGNFTTTPPAYPNCPIVVATVLNSNPTEGNLFVFPKINHNNGATFNSLGIINNLTLNDTQVSDFNQLNVNSSTFWASLTDVNYWFTKIGNILGLNTTYFNRTYDTRYIMQVNESKLNVNSSVSTTYWSGETNQSNLNVNNSDYWNGLDTQTNITQVGTLINLNVSGSINTSDYYYGQPLAGSTDSGIIYSSNIDSSGNINISHTGLNLSYPDIIVRTVSTETYVEHYCVINASSVIVPDNAHTAYFVTPECTIGNAPISSFVSSAINVNGNAPIFHIMAHSGNIEVHQGLPIMNRINIKSRVLNFKTINLDVISGLNFVEDAALNFSITAGEYVYVDTAVDSTTQNLTDGASFEIVYRDGGVWNYDEYEGSTQTGLNLTSCEDASENLVTCSLPLKFRRYFILLTGYTNGDDDTEVHQLLASNEIIYNNIGDCLNTESNPLTYTVPDIYTFTAVPLYAYCSQGSATTFTGSFIDLRETQTSVAGGGIDTSIFLTIDGTRSLTANWDAGNSVFNITASWFKGFIDWSDVQNKFITAVGKYFNMDGTTLKMNTTELNATIDARVSISGNYTAGLGIKLDGTNYSVEAGNGLAQDLDGLRVADAGINNTLLRWKTAQNLTISDSPTFNDLNITGTLNPTENLTFGKGWIIPQGEYGCFDASCNHYIYENSSGVLIIV